MNLILNITQHKPNKIDKNGDGVSLSLVLIDFQVYSIFRLSISSFSFVFVFLPVQQAIDKRE